MPSQSNFKKESKKKKEENAVQNLQNSPSTERRNEKLKKILGPQAPSTVSSNRNASRSFSGTALSEKMMNHVSAASAPQRAHARTISATRGGGRSPMMMNEEEEVIALESNESPSISPFPSPSILSSSSLSTSAGGSSSVSPFPSSSSLSSAALSSSTGSVDSRENSAISSRESLEVVEIEVVNKRSTNTGDKLPPTSKTESGPVDKIVIENQTLKRLLEEKKKREMNLRKELQKYDLKSWNENIRKLNARIRDLESGNVPKTEPIKVEEVKMTPAEMELEKLKAEIISLEKKNLELRESFDRLDKVSKENQKQVDELNIEAESLREKSAIFRDEVLKKKKQKALERGELYVATSEFVVEKEGDLCLQLGDLVQILVQGSDGWWEGYNFRSFYTGVFPSNFVEKYEEKQIERKVVAKFNFDAKSDDEFSFYQGDEIIVIKENPNGWWFGLHVLSNSKGLFPCNFVS